MSTPVVGSSMERRYYEQGDYISFVGFRINAEQNDMDVFAMPLNGSNGKMKYLQYGPDELKTLLTHRWGNTVLQPYNSGSAPFSLVSVAKAYALAAVKSEGQMVNRTFLVMITDRHYNGNNFYDEMQALHWKQEELRLANPLTSRQIFERCYEVEQNYLIKYLSTYSVWNGNTYSPKGYVEFYEYVPLQQHFMLSSVVNYPSHLRAVRQCDDSYIVTLPLSLRGNQLYKVLRTDVFLCSNDTIHEQSPDDAIHLNGCDTTLTLQWSQGSKPRYVGLRVWMALRDGVYEATLMSPSLQSPQESGRDGLNIFIPVEQEPDATVFGQRLSGWAWRPLSWAGNQHRVAKIYEIAIYVILLILLIVAVSYYLTRPIHYHPGEGDFRLGKRNMK